MNSGGSSASPTVELAKVGIGSVEADDDSDVAVPSVSVDG